ncbi:MAG: TPM domain-containing protein [Chryseolinea sp.]
MKQVLFTLIIAVVVFVSCESKKSLTGTGSILDSANILTEREEDSLFFLIQELSNHTGPQVAIVTIDTLRGEKMEDYSLRTAEKMRIGRKTFDDGILITVAVKNKQMRIEVGRGLEKIIKDEVANKIIIFDIAPRFKTGDFFGGLRIAVVKMTTLIENDKKLIGN